MGLRSIAYVSLCLTMLCGCCADPVVERVVVTVQVPAPVPEACRLLRALPLPTGTTAQGVIEAQAAVIREYEAQVAACTVSEKK